MGKKNDFIIKPKYFIIDNPYKRWQNTLRQTIPEMMKRVVLMRTKEKEEQTRKGAGGSLSLHKYKNWLWRLAKARLGTPCQEDRRLGRCSNRKGEVEQLSSALGDHGLRKSTVCFLADRKQCGPTGGKSFIFFWNAQPRAERHLELGSNMKAGFHIHIYSPPYLRILHPWSQPTKDWKC